MCCARRRAACRRDATGRLRRRRWGGRCWRRRGAAGEAGAGVAVAGGAAAAGKSKALVTKAQQLQKVDDGEKAQDLTALSDLLRSDHEDVAIKSALATAAVCARDPEKQQQLADVGGLPRIVALLDGEYSPRSLLDLTLCLKALTANKMHHPNLLTQFVQAGGPKKLVKLVSTGDKDVSQAALQIIRSLADAEGPRKALIKENALPPLLRCLRPSMPQAAVEPASAALSVFTLHESECCQAVLNAQGIPSLTQLLSRGADSLAAHSAASCLAHLCTSDEVGTEARKRARDAGALEALLPLLDGVLAGNGSQAATAESRMRRLGGALPRLVGHRRRDAHPRRAQSVVGLLSAPSAPPNLRGRRLRGHRRVRRERLGVARRAPPPRRGAAPRGPHHRRHEGRRRRRSRCSRCCSSAATRTWRARLRVRWRPRRTRARPISSRSFSRATSSQGVRRCSSTASPSTRRPRARRLSSSARCATLVKMCRGGPKDLGTLNALGALEVLAHGATTVQDEAREAGIFPTLVPLLRPADAAAEEGRASRRAARTRRRLARSERAAHQRGALPVRARAGHPGEPRGGEEGGRGRGGGDAPRRRPTLGGHLPRGRRDAGPRAERPRRAGEGGRAAAGREGE